MFVAQRHLSTVIDGKVVKFQPGDQVPNFEKWNEVAKRANLSMEYVVEVPDESSPAPVKAKSGKKKPRN